MKKAVTKSETGTWELGRRTWDSGMWVARMRGRTFSTPEPISVGMRVLGDA